MYNPIPILPHINPFQKKGSLEEVQKRNNQGAQRGPQADRATHDAVPTQEMVAPNQVKQLINTQTEARDPLTGIRNVEGLNLESGKADSPPTSEAPQVTPGKQMSSVTKNPLLLAHQSRQPSQSSQQYQEAAYARP